MSDMKPWPDYQEWHELLDAICVDQGHFDNMALASTLSSASRGGNSAAYEAALKNLQNWRQGSHVPQRRNFLLLTKVLGIDSYDGLRDHWIRLYGNSSPRRSDNGANTHADAAAPSLPVSERGERKVIPRTMSALSLATPLVLATVVAGVTYVLDADPEIPAKGIQDADVEYRPSTTIGVGESTVVHGLRGSCGKGPPDWERVLARLPELDIGTWSDGGVGVRFSRRCSGPTPARGVVFTATRSGEAELTLFGDPVVIRVE